MLKILQYLIIFGNFGLLAEVYFTGIYSLWHKNWRAKAETSLWLFPVYAIGGLTFKIIHDSVIIVNNPFLNSIVMSFLFYVPLIYGFELLYGLLTEKILGYRLWDYGLSKFTPFGLINFKYLPWWFILTLLFQLGVVYLNRLEAILKW